MALLSGGARYGLQACLLLAVERGAGPVPGAVIARRLGVPPQYLPVVLHRLKSAGIVAASRGQRGGYRLARTPARITALAVVEAVDGPLAVAADIGDRDAADRLLVRVGSCLHDELSLSLAEILRRHGTEAPPMFHI